MLHKAQHIEISSAELFAEIQELGRNASFEILPGTRMDFVDMTRPGTRIHLTDFSSDQRDVNRDLTIRLSAEFAQKGFTPVPHIAARRIKSHDDLDVITTRMKEVGVTHVMLIAGDGKPAGEFESSMDLLKTGVMKKFNNIAVAGHPNAGILTTPRRGQATDALKWKNDYAQVCARDMRIVTQLEYDADTILDYEAKNREQGNILPIYVGLTGPASLEEKKIYAKRCMLDISKIVLNQGSNIFKAFSERVPDQLITTIARSRIEARKEGLSGIAGLHFFTFGVAPRTVGFTNSLINGDFVMNDENIGFKLQMAN